MKPLAWTLLAYILTLLFLALPAAATPGDPVLPGGECGGLVDVDCDDYNDHCSFTSCDHIFVRHCLVWVAYLDIALPPELHALDRFGVCQDNPYYP